VVPRAANTTSDVGAGLRGRETGTGPLSVPPASCRRRTNDKNHMGVPTPAQWLTHRDDGGDPKKPTADERRVNPRRSQALGVPSSALRKRWKIFRGIAMHDLTAVIRRWNRRCCVACVVGAWRLVGVFVTAAYAVVLVVGSPPPWWRWARRLQGRVIDHFEHQTCTTFTRGHHRHADRQLPSSTGDDHTSMSGCRDWAWPAGSWRVALAREGPRRSRFMVGHVGGDPDHRRRAGHRDPGGLATGLDRRCQPTSGSATAARGRCWAPSPQRYLPGGGWRGSVFGWPTPLLVATTLWQFRLHRHRTTPSP